MNKANITDHLQNFVHDFAIVQCLTDLNTILFRAFHGVPLGYTMRSKKMQIFILMSLPLYCENRKML